jgi:hypothetical protein
LLIKQKFVILQLTLKYIAMIKKILLTLITVFAFSNVNAQNIASFDTCNNVWQEFAPSGLINGKDSYTGTTASTGAGSIGEVYGTITTSSSLGIEFNGTEWVFYFGSDVSNDIWTNSFTTGTKAPNDGWISSGDPCPADKTLELFDNNTSVLDVETMELNDVSVYPNPSSDFISVSNLKDAVQCRITNIAGQTVLSKVVDANDNQMDVQELSKGFYFVEIAGKKTLKFIKK